MPNNFENFLGVYLGQCQDIENDLYTLLTQSGYAGDLNLISNTQLDNYASIFNLKRKGLTDVQLRQAIKVIILANVSTGTVDNLIQIIQQYTQAVSGVSTSPKITELGNAQIFIELGFFSSDIDRVAELKTYINISKASGIGFYGWYDTSFGPFKFSDSSDSQPVISPEEGFGSTPIGTEDVSTNGPGGEWSSVI